MSANLSLPLSSRFFSFANKMKRLALMKDLSSSFAFRHYCQRTSSTDFVNGSVKIEVQVKVIVNHTFRMGLMLYRLFNKHLTVMWL
ncbi:MAG: hypothetical protein ACI8T1_001924 [Verrucomicrobiales bacterium]|jgi:hypothetical protein